MMCDWRSVGGHKKKSAFAERRKQKNNKMKSAIFAIMLVMAVLTVAQRGEIPSMSFNLKKFAAVSQGTATTCYGGTYQFYVLYFSLNTSVFPLVKILMSVFHQ